MKLREYTPQGNAFTCSAPAILVMTFAFASRDGLHVYLARDTTTVVTLLTLRGKCRLLLMASGYDSDGGGGDGEEGYVPCG